MRRARSRKRSLRRFWIDGGAAQSDSVYFQRADSQFTRAYTLAKALNNTAVANAALGERASIRAWLGDWNAAVADAILVPNTFVFNAIFGTGTTRENNDLANQTITRRETTVFGTRFATIFKDPRTPWDTVKTTSGAVQTGQDGKTKFFRQTKYTSLGSSVPLVKGAEMLVLRAEAALRNGDITGMTTLINQERARGSVREISHRQSGCQAKCADRVRMRAQRPVRLHDKRGFSGDFSSVKPMAAGIVAMRCITAQVRPVTAS